MNTWLVSGAKNKAIVSFEGNGRDQGGPATHAPDQPDETTLCFQSLDCDWAVLNPHRHVQGRIRYLLFSCHVSSSSYHIYIPTTTFQNHINCLHFPSSEQ
ncbi:unnamed protein product [Prunus armeniaca]|uniref:Uncharacterized protein n=1 Tax=Prunus armeniaca TaxID=36596 RepID=A0A6J5UZB5_PRUAR|nr:unnamed protein product [Prunus armeniaca]